MVRSNVPKRGDVFLIDLNPVVGNEMKDEHRCVVITPKEINAVGMCLVVPITTGGMFTRKAGLAVNISGHRTTGVALCNQVRSLDIAGRIAQKRAKFLERLDDATIQEIVARVVSMIDPA
ncbi:type II toxin-antitoxin system PemK/MazF family toxin [Agrobacterium rubi]|uniref:type II toxin-antitoxin system PemK/MazF family toxin n=1 Tax=Agrobacterium rubi TaxID=28099 RepID=UPI001573E547|nr:type II toxin-antitoxin system PemK/MazF family toxin [Agrobacterium rubi]NTF06823.1 type II toxin-antitoxin system PemK/MazF family toxin [Agrobacterium rubi]NTF19065.1 type II toxin-antitoxin system PemK/MazF family toxin [Agrobacterium rubi]NTF26028.1 type II toxin-antitoxin system PemK/MazF family toxin [Agrobacterium rubi]